MSFSNTKKILLNNDDYEIEESVIEAVEIVKKVHKLGFLIHRENNNYIRTINNSYVEVLRCGSPTSGCHGMSRETHVCGMSYYNLRGSGIWLSLGRLWGLKTCTAYLRFDWIVSCIFAPPSSRVRSVVDCVKIPDLSTPYLGSDVHLYIV